MRAPASPSRRRRTESALTTAVAAALVAALVAGCSSSSSTAEPPPAAGSSNDSGTPAASTGSGDQADQTAGDDQSSGEAQLKRLDSTGKLKGNAGRMDFPAGEPGKLSVVDVGPPDLSAFGYLPVLVRNNTDETYRGVDIAAKGVDASGQAVSIGDNRGITIPAEVGPGELAFATLWLSPPPPSANGVKWAVRATGETDDVLYPYATMSVTDVSVTRGSFIVSATNDSGEELTNPHTALIACFSKAGDLLAVNQGLDNAGNDVPEGGPLDFSGDLTGPCPRYMVGASAHIP